MLDGCSTHPVVWAAHWHQLFVFTVGHADTHVTAKGKHCTRKGLHSQGTCVLQAYHGGLQHVRDPSARASRVHKVVDKAAAAVEAISNKAGLQCQVVTGGGSGTYRIEAASGVFTEVQPGGCWLCLAAAFRWAVCACWWGSVHVLLSTYTAACVLTWQHYVCSCGWSAAAAANM
jgi:D-serine deaminase-like pyridoxal phosphate-dependent protein